MKKIPYLTILMCVLLLGAAPQRQNDYTTGTTIRANDVTANEDEIFGYLQTGVDTIRTSGLDTITEIDSALKSGSDATLITGTKGADGICAEWNADGDLVAAASAAACGSGGSGGAPTTADYLVGTANASLSAEIVVGTSPAGELGGTWASPTIDATHSGSAHHDSVTLAGTPDYITLSGQAITRTKLDMSDDTNLTCGTNCTLTANDIAVDDAFLVNNANDETSGGITATGIIVSTNMQATNLVSCDTIDTDSAGNFACGSDETGGAASAVKEIAVVPFDFATETSIGDGAYYIHVGDQLDGRNLTSVQAAIISTGITGTLDIDLAKCNALVVGSPCTASTPGAVIEDMLSTNLTIDTLENNSGDAAAAAVIDTSFDDVSEDDFIRVDIDGVHTTKAKGLIVTLGFETP